MGRAGLAVAMLVLTAQRALAQPAPIPNAIQPLPPAGSLSPANSAQIDEIRSLRASLQQLQNRLDQLASPSGGPASRPSPEIGETATQPGDAPSTSMPPAPALGSDRSTNWPLTASWNNGLHFASADDTFRVHVGGRLQFDAGWNAASQAVQFGPGGTGELADGAYFRRARVRIDGTMYSHLEWVAEFDFANAVDNDNASTPQPIGSPSFTDVWIGVNDLPAVGTMRIGWMKEPIGLEHMTSASWLPFMERTPGSDSLGLRSPGILFRNTDADERMTWAVGFFHAQKDNFGFGVGDGQYAETGRLTWLPWYEDEGCQLVHLGIGASHRHLAGNEGDFRGRPSVRTQPGTLLPALANTGSISAPTLEVFGAELAGVYGPWTLQSEYYCTFIHDAVFPSTAPPVGIPRGTLFYQGCYVELLYFLTGEHSQYDRQSAVFGRVIPLHNFNVWSGEWGPGAWQVGVRYGYLDLQDKGVNGATLNDIVLGVNWFLNPNARIEWNLATDHRDSTPAGSSGWTYIFGGRLAIDF